jgi:hypothetical protein
MESSVKFGCIYGAGEYKSGMGDSVEHGTATG